MTRALIIGASGGIGAALAQACAARGDEVTGLSRSQDGLDVTREGTIERALGGLSGSYDLILVATGGLEIASHGPEKTLRGLDPEALAAQFALNAMGPVLVLKHALRLMPRDGRAVFGAMSARVGSIGDNALGGWYSYRAAKSALNQLLHTAAIEIGRSHKHAVCVALHPGTVATNFTAKYIATHATVPPADAAQNLLRVIDGLTPAQTGSFVDWAGKTIPW